MSKVTLSLDEVEVGEALRQYVRNKYGDSVVEIEEVKTITSRKTGAVSAEVECVLRGRTRVK